MSEANTATYDIHDRGARITDMALRAAYPTPRPSTHRAKSYRVDTAQPFVSEDTEWQVREDKAFYIPDFLSDQSYDSDPDLHDAADEHAKHLRRAERYLDEAVNLVGVLRASIGDEGDSRAMQADTMLKLIEQKLDKACNRIDRHDTRHRKLFLAYFDLKEKADEEEGDEE